MVRKARTAELNALLSGPRVVFGVTRGGEEYLIALAVTAVRKHEIVSRELECPCQIAV